MVTRRDYTAEAVDAARSVLIEIMHLLGEYREHIVLIGGWVPEFLLPNKSQPHVGSMDIDLALNHRTLQEEGYRTILELLSSRGYHQGNQPFIFYRMVNVGRQELRVQVDLLAGEYEGTGRGRRHQRIQGIQVRTVRGCDLAFEMSFDVTIEGELPEGGKDSVRIRVASIVPFFVMKGMALDERLKEKDAWDIYYCVQNFPGGLDGLVELFQPYVEQGLVREGLQKIAKHFASENHIAPRFVADFEELTDPEERAFRQRDAYERMHYFLEKLGMT